MGRSAWGMALAPLALASLLVGCADAPNSTGFILEPPISTPDSANLSTAVSFENGRCRPPAEAKGDPQSIDELVAYINAMPRPLSLACFLESLSRPLLMNTTKSFFSAQPAVGARSPRIFLFLGPLTLSVVPEGDARVLLEMSEATSPARSIKAEIAFPVIEQLTEESPFERLPLSNLTACGVCHDLEEPVRGIEGAMESEALRPAAREVVPVDDIREEFETCDPLEELERCEMLDALFNHGSVLQRAFPQNYPTIFD